MIKDNIVQSVGIKAGSSTNFKANDMVTKMQISQKKSLSASFQLNEIKGLISMIILNDRTYRNEQQLKMFQKVQKEQKIKPIITSEEKTNKL